MTTVASRPPGQENWRRGRRVCLAKQPRSTGPQPGPVSPLRGESCEFRNRESLLASQARPLTAGL
ncbi:uncharacterized protein B0I36DRAFT_311675 [Microdochium trichocladiopsis]|uniref:Uncharacterized protein n=1 Tax=Microdochium trichocladiopsis TaxID=1682393 RepID=A0A9P9BW06_9PEZI|nr:uncharacterized protein B0I36DRAFT_311675 [Microdochium trichocladiopsis]KAH7040873.1 hypothetical protein B0I36DRAFT_311675 [Microdochium trichocladiopsis]